MPSSQDPSEDPRAAQELANLLGRELVSAKQRIASLESQLRVSEEHLDQARGTRLQKSPDSHATRDIEKEIESYKSEERRLRQQIKNLRKKINDDKSKATSSLRNEITTLRNQRDDAREEAKKTKEAYKLLQSSIATDINYASNGVGNGVSKSPFEIMSSLPLYLFRPDHRTLNPIAKKPLRYPDLVTLLGANPKTNIYAGSSLYFPGRFAWCTSPRGYHHALSFWPTHAFNTASRRWEKNTTMEGLYGCIRELFYMESGKVYYAGTYKAVRFNNPTMAWPSPDVEGLRSFEMAGAALSEDFSNAPCSQVHKGTISKLYRDGVLRLECMGLQCVGFNKMLYNKLLTQCGEDSPSKEKRRLRGVEESSAKKRRKE